MRGTRTGQGLVTGALFTRPAAYTPAVTWAGNTISVPTPPTGLYLKMTGLLIVWARFNISTGGVAGAISISVPTGYTALSSDVGVLSKNSAVVAAADFAYQMRAAAGALTALTGSPTTTATTGADYAIMALIPITT